MIVLARLALILLFCSLAIPALGHVPELNFSNKNHSIDQVIKSYLITKSSQKEGQLSKSGGSFIFSVNGKAAYAITSAHVVGNPTKIELATSGSYNIITKRIVGISPENDIALWYLVLDTEIQHTWKTKF